MRFLKNGRTLGAKLANYLLFGWGGLAVILCVTLTGCDTLPPSDPPDSVRWPGMAELPWSEWTLVSEYPRISYRTRVHPKYSNGNYTSGYLSHVEVRNEDSVDADLLISLFNNRGWMNRSAYFWETVGANNTKPTEGRKRKTNTYLLETGIVLPRKAVVASTVYMDRTSDVVKIEADVAAPAGWNSLKSRNMENIFWKSSTSEESTFVNVPDDRSKSSTGFRVDVTFWNRRAEPVVIDFVIVPDSSTQGMPDPARHVGGGSLTLLGGATATMARVVAQKDWSIYTNAKSSVLE